MEKLTYLEHLKKKLCDKLAKGPPSECAKAIEEYNKAKMNLQGKGGKSNGK